MVLGGATTEIELVNGFIKVLIIKRVFFVRKNVFDLFATELVQVCCYSDTR